MRYDSYGSVATLTALVICVVSVAILLLRLTQGPSTLEGRSAHVPAHNPTVISSDIVPAK
jgi:hypothetical protein